uniref:TIR domain-containing protein n=1 Tax=Salix viminalis TaxID=40686 RepID=A0A6N2M5H6_SALVM
MSSGFNDGIGLSVFLLAQQTIPVPCSPFGAAMTEPKSSRSRPKEAYDVFLSFRGEDSRKNFTDNLYTALVQAGIHTFLDQIEISRGEEISKSLHKAIQESKISVVLRIAVCLSVHMSIVFSKGYASSRWCLDELVEILESKNRKTDQIILPIFYDINPSELRKQTGSFAKTFHRHEAAFTEKVKEWRKALEEAGNLSGWNLNDMENGHESKFIQEIVKDVLNKLDPTCRLHCGHTWDARNRKQLCSNQLCYRFEGSCFLSNINEISEQSNGLALLQEQLLHDILKQSVVNINNVDRGVVLIKERICHKRVLIVVDDVSHQNQLNALMGERSWFGPGSRVVITTKDEHLLLKVDRTYRVEELKRDESLQLFSWHAFGDTKPTKDYVELCDDVVDYCGGLPLALEVLGSKLDGKVNKEYVAKVLEARCGYNPEDDLGTLRERSLIKVDAFGNISMHDQLRDMGRDIIHEESPGHPGKRSRIWQHKDAWNVLNKHTGMEVVEGLALDARASEDKSLSTRSFTKMKCLKLLQINGVHLTGPFKLLSEELIWICWLEFPLKSFPSDLMLSNLVVLDMQYSNIKELWREKKILNKLKILNLSHSKHLIKTPNLHSSSLEKLMLEGCSSLVEVHQSVGHLKSLVSLNLKGCWRIKILPESICDVKSLESLNISGCSQLEKLPERMGDIESLTELLADEIQNEQFLSSIGHLKYVRKLSVRVFNFNHDSVSSTSCPSPISRWISASVLNVKAFVPTFFIDWRSVKGLKLDTCGLSESETNCVYFGGLSSLEELDLSGNKFLSVPSGIGVLTKLQRLRVQNCSNLVSISELPSSLEILQADCCRSMKRVCLPIQSKINPILSLDGCENLIEIQGMEGLSNHGCVIFSGGGLDLSNNSKKSFVEALRNGGYGYQIHFDDDKVPNWFSFHGEGSSLSFHVPPVFQGFVLWFALEYAGIVKGWIRYVSISEMEMEEYGGDEELELSVNLTNTNYAVKECGVHVIAEMSSFEQYYLPTEFPLSRMVLVRKFSPDFISFEKSMVYAFFRFVLSEA